jgi:hypothetical protein
MRARTAQTETKGEDRRDKGGYYAAQFRRTEANKLRREKARVKRFAKRAEREIERARAARPGGIRS